MSLINKIATLGLASFVACASLSAASELEKVMKKRGLNQMDILAAAKTYTPTGMHDKYIVFSSGGQSGQLMVYGVPSMRILKFIAVFTPEPWQGYGYDEESKKILEEGKIRGKYITWGDTHHPALSETNGAYDGKWVFLNDKANPRVAVISLKDFETKQIVVNPILKSEHGGTFVTPNTEYIFESSQYAAPFDNEYHPMSEYKEVYRGAITFWKFDRKKGRIMPKLSFSLELPPYMQDLSDAGKKDSYGWGFTNSFNSEMYTGGIEKGLPPFEAGTSRNDTDFLHVYNWKLLSKLVKDKKNYKIINGTRVIPIDVAVKNHALFLIPEPKSPHGVDVSPDGKYIVVAGKLDTHVSVYSFAKIMKLIKDKDYAGKDPYGIPILDMKKALYGQVELGLGPLHTEFLNTKGDAVTSLYVDSQVVKWNYLKLKVLDRINVHYNIGHLTAMQGDTVEPAGEYVIALNKLAIDRFSPVGPLHPQNHQLIDVGGTKMELLYDMPVPLGEPHRAAAILASKLSPIARYELGEDSRTMSISPGKTLAGQERVVRDGKEVTVYATAIRSHLNPEHVTVNVGDTVTFYITNLERSEDETHGFTIDDLNVHASLEPGKTASVKFKATQEGVYPYYCTEFCSALHLEMMGYLLVKDPKREYKSVKKLAMKKLSKAQLMQEYNKQIAINKQTDAVIQDVVKFLKANHYEKYANIKALATDALAQYAKIAKQKDLANKAFKEGDINKAILFESMVWQYMVKTADSGIKARDLLVRKIATKQSAAAKAGEQDFKEYGCSGCHVIGKVSSGPDLTGVLLRHEGGKKWVMDFIMHPKKYYKDPYIKSMIDYFNLKMPNQGVGKKAAGQIVEYLQWVDDNANLF